MTRRYLIAPWCCSINNPFPLLHHQGDIRPHRLAIRAHIATAPNGVLIQLWRFLLVQLRPRQSSPTDCKGLNISITRTSVTLIPPHGSSYLLVLLSSLSLAAALSAVPFERVLCLEIQLHILSLEFLLELFTILWSQINSPIRGAAGGSVRQTAPKSEWDNSYPALPEQQCLFAQDCSVFVEDVYTHCYQAWNVYEW